MKPRISSRSFLFGLCILLPAVAGCRQSPPDPDPNRFAAAIERFAAQNENSEPAPNPILFVGSSSIGGWKLEEYFPDLPVLNRGFGGSQISDINFFLDRVVIEYQPRVVVFYAGENDIHARKRVDRVVEDFTSFVRSVTDTLPDTDIIYLPMKPSPSRMYLWSKMERGNLKIRDLSERTDRLHYVDTASPLIRADGRARPELFLEDSLHMNQNGYEIWARLLKPELIRLGN